MDTSKYFFATYDLEGEESLANAAWELAIGQSVGNPHVRNKWETDDLFENYKRKTSIRNPGLQIMKFLFSAVRYFNSFNICNRDL